MLSESSAEQELRGPAKETTRILIVEDDLFFRKYLSRLLGNRQRKIYEACTAIDALYLAHLMAPEVLLIDIGLNGDFDGLSLLQALRQDAAFTGLPVVVVSGSDNPESKAKATQLGVDFFLGKPIESKVLLDIVARLEGS